MATDTMFGQVRQFEDFLLTAIGDKPEIDIQTSSSTAITTDADGRLRITDGGGNDEDVGAVSFNLNWVAGESDLYMEARCFLSNTTDNKYFVGFADVLASADETTFSATSDAVTIDTISDGIGILWEGDATNLSLWAVAGKTNAVTVNTALPTRLNPVATEAFTLGCKISLDRKFAEFYVNGELVHTVNSDTTLIAAVALAPSVYTYAQATAFNLDVDYLYAKKGRSTS